MPSQKIRHNGTWLDIPIVGPTNAAMQAAAEAAAGPAAAEAVDANPTIADHESRIGTTEIAADLLTAQRFDPAHPDYGAIEGTGLTSAQRIANVAAFNAAAAAAAAADGVLEARGVFEIEGGISIAGRMVDMRMCALEQYDGDAVSVTYGTTTSGAWVDSPFAYLPSVNNETKVATGWSGLGVGIRVANVRGGQVFFQTVRHFPTGIDVAAYGYAMTDVNFYLGLIVNNKIGLHVRGGDATGWANENNFFGGKWQSTGAEGNEIPGMTHLKMTRFPGGLTLDKNVFHKPNVEGNGPEYHIDMDGVRNTLIVSPRMETSSGIKPKWRINDGGQLLVLWGYQLEDVTWSGDSVDGVDVVTGEMKALRGHYSGGVLRVKNTDPDSSDGPVIVSPPDESTHLSMADNGYLWRFGTRTFKAKSGADTYPRLQMNFAGSDRAIRMGSGSAPPETSLGRINNLPEGVVASDPGSVIQSGQGRMFLKVTGTGNTGWLEMTPVRSGTTAARPSTALLPVGAPYFDTTLGKQINWNGTNWVDATGTVV